MEQKDELPEEADGLRLVRAFLTLPPEKRNVVLKFIDELSHDQEPCAEATETFPR